VAAPAAQADFSSDVYFSDDGGTTVLEQITVEEGTALSLTLFADLTFDDPANGLTLIQLNFSGSDAALGVAGATWTWSAAVQGNMTGAVAPFPDDSVSGDGSVGRMSQLGQDWEVGDGVTELGTLDLTAPAYVEGGDNSHTIAFETGGTTPTSIGGIAGNSALTTEPLDVNVTPEPATLALLALGGTSLLLRRRR
jgi:hypothetical protein